MTRNTRSPEQRRPLRRDAELNRNRILASASEVFGERGLEATLDDIAHHAGLGVGTVYRRFPSKEHLVEAMFVERLNEINDLIEHTLEEPDAWEGFVQCVWQMARLHTADRGLREILLSNAYGRDRVAEAKARLGPVCIKVFQRAQESGQLRSDANPMDLPLLQLMLGSIAEYTHDIEPRLWRRYFSILLDGLRAKPGRKSTLDCLPLDEDMLEKAMSSWRCPNRRNSDLDVDHSGKDGDGNKASAAMPPPPRKRSENQSA